MSDADPSDIRRKREEYWRRKEAAAALAKPSTEASETSDLEASSAAQPETADSIAPREAQAHPTETVDSLAPTEAHRTETADLAASTESRPSTSVSLELQPFSASSAVAPCGPTIPNIVFQFFNPMPGVMPQQLDTARVPDFGGFFQSLLNFQPNFNRAQPSTNLFNMAQPSTSAGLSCGSSKPSTSAAFSCGSSKPSTSAGISSEDSKPSTSAGISSEVSKPSTSADSQGGFIDLTDNDDCSGPRSPDFAITGSDFESGSDLDDPQDEDFRPGPGAVLPPAQQRNVRVQKTQQELRDLLARARNTSGSRSRAPTFNFRESQASTSAGYRAPSTSMFSGMTNAGRAAPAAANPSVATPAAAANAAVATPAAAANAGVTGPVAAANPVANPQEPAQPYVPPGYGCSICLDGRFEVRLRCNHMFCHACVTHQLATQRVARCSICKARFRVFSKVFGG